MTTVKVGWFTSVVVNQISLKMASFCVVPEDGTISGIWAVTTCPPSVETQLSKILKKLRSCVSIHMNEKWPRIGIIGAQMQMVRSYKILYAITDVMN